jgi:hypothetical protein
MGIGGGNDRSKRSLIVPSQPKEIGKGIATLGPKQALNTIESNFFEKVLCWEKKK